MSPMKCPVCHQDNLGLVGRIRYYCPDCNVEIVVKGRVLEIYEIKKDGGLKLVKLLAS
ncbi:MAG TPA: hypothetical protein PLL17_10025 [Defluviitaleaceae bacterium]|nr:hypothetical protein [Defluviitaleaceae bacterium]HPT75125.1 hypothetical protein [Defluviitaleaceae bacterium]HQD51448.1 hypothetical protein [Defluviitaleaceae bacterium]